ncbi:hypothetical protein PBAL39_11702 [Pedobacter sp. BAL39]|nr:hypothetical protein PBAL39_11702 [Pedobacter sp. BAL39]
MRSEKTITCSGKHKLFGKKEQIQLQEMPGKNDDQKKIKTK